MRCLPVLFVIGEPLALEALRVTGASPKFGLFQVDGLDSGIERLLHADAEELAIILRWTHVIDVAAVADFFPVAVGLGVVLVVFSVEATVEIILILSPGDAGH